MRRKYLIIAMDMANLAAGIVFKRIVSAMSAYAKCEVVCPDVDEKIISEVDVLPCPCFKRYHHKIENWSFHHYGLRLSEYLWGNKASVKLYSLIKRNDYDAIISMVYGSNLAPLILGKRLSTKMKLPWAIYTVDAIPTPLTYLPDKELNKKIKQIVRKYCEPADALFAANPNMLKYELDCLEGFNGVSDVVLTPCDFSNYPINKKNNNREIVFLYAGGLYGPRRLAELLKGFELLLKTMPNAKLVFVGDSNISQFKGFEYLLESGAIEKHMFTKEIEYFYERADVLIDLNADVESDVFLSSKVCNYLSYNKPIVSISQDGSPVRKLMSGCETIIHSHHDYREIAEALGKATKMINADFSERSVLRKKFTPNEVAMGFCKGLELMVNNNRKG